MKFGGGENDDEFGKSECKSRMERGKEREERVQIQKFKTTFTTRGAFKEGIIHPTVRISWVQFFIKSFLAKKYTIKPYS